MLQDLLLSRHSADAKNGVLVVTLPHYGCGICVITACYISLLQSQMYTCFPPIGPVGPGGPFLPKTPFSPLIPGSPFIPFSPFIPLNAAATSLRYGAAACRQCPSRPQCICYGMALRVAPLYLGSGSNAAALFSRESVMCDSRLCRVSLKY